MIAMHIADLVDARTALASGAHAYSSSYTHCEVNLDPHRSKASEQWHYGGSGPHHCNCCHVVELPAALKMLLNCSSSH